jgi:hypothetical protein
MRDTTVDNGELIRAVRAGAPRTSVILTALADQPH